MPAAVEPSPNLLGDGRSTAALGRLASCSDERLASRLCQGDESAFELLYRRHYRGLLGLCRRLLRCHHEAEDAVQQVFASAYLALAEKQERPSRVGPWLYAIGRNRCVSILRSKREDGALLTEDVGAATSDPAGEAERRAELSALVEDIRKLPESQRAALVLAELGGLSHRDVAKTLGCRPAKVRALVFQARSTLVEQREARGASCLEVRAALANVRGAHLHGLLRRHVRLCPGCADFRSARQSRRLSAPHRPSLASQG